MDFTDFTLACEDGQHIEAHEVILAAFCPISLYCQLGTGVATALMNAHRSAGADEDVSGSVK